MKPRQKTRKSINFTRAEWKPIARWIASQRPKISEAEGLRRLASMAMHAQAMARAQGQIDYEGWGAEQPTRKRAEP